MPTFSGKKLTMIALLLDEEEEGKEKTKRMWVREMIRERKDVGEYHTLYHGCATHDTEGKRFKSPHPLQ